MSHEDDVTLACRGTNLRGPGPLAGLIDMEHHAYMYSLYCNNPKLPCDGYIYHIFKEFSILVSRLIITRWFQKIGPFKGTMRATSVFPPGKYTPGNIELLEEFIEFCSVWGSHRDFVFSDEKLMKEVDLSGRARRDPITGEIPHEICNANARNRYNVLAAVTLKRHVAAVEALVLEDTGTACFFANFVAHFLETGTLARGDVFIVDNCTIHFIADCRYLQETLLSEAGVLMLPLPPYHAELNPV